MKMIVRSTLVLLAVSAPLIVNISFPTIQRDTTLAQTSQTEEPAPVPALGLVAFESPFSVEETAARLESAISGAGLNLVARVDHAAAAQRVGLELRPTQVFIFGNPISGTPLMQCNQTAGIDLPQKALVWQDVSGRVLVGFNDQRYLGVRHQLFRNGCADEIDQTQDALNQLIKQVVTP